MTFPSNIVVTENLATGASDPSLARVDLLDALEKLNDIIEGANEALGVVLLTGSGLIPGNKLPAQIALPSGVQVINPASGVVNIRDILRLQSTAAQDILAQVDSQAGDIAFCTEENTLVIYTGVNWKILDLSGASDLEI